MAKKKVSSAEEVSQEDLGEFTQDIVETINSTKKDGKVAYNLSKDESPTNISYFIDSGSSLLNFILSNDTKGGWPAGRIVEISGPPSCGKSHLAFQAIKAVQRDGGLGILADTENATSIQNLQLLGVDLNKLVYLQPSCTEDVFEIAEHVIKKASASKKDIKIVFVWDSIAATSPKPETESDFAQNTIGLQARVLSRGFRKITQTIGNNKVTFLCLNQLRNKINTFGFGDPTTTTGGFALHYHSSVRVKLVPTSQIKTKDENGFEKNIGINVRAKVFKNKISFPNRECDFEIHFGKGIYEHNQIFDLLKTEPETKVGDKFINVVDSKAWRSLEVRDEDRNFIDDTDKKFRKDEWPDRMKKWGEYLNPMIEDTIKKKLGIKLNIDSLEEVKEIQKQQEE